MTAPERVIELFREGKSIAQIALPDCPPRRSKIHGRKIKIGFLDRCLEIEAVIREALKKNGVGPA